MSLEAARVLNALGPNHPVRATVVLNNGVIMPVVGVTSWLSDDQVVDDIKTAVKAGYRHIEVSTVYGNEELVGEAIRELISERVVERHELFVTLKMWIPNMERDIHDEMITALGKLQMNRVDACIAHFPLAFNRMSLDNVENIWHHFAGLVHDGLTRSIGVANWFLGQLVHIQNRDIHEIHISMSEAGMYLPQLENSEFCADHDVVMTRYGTMGSPNGLNFTVATDPADPKWDPLADLDRMAPWRIAQERGKTVPQILLRFAVEKGFRTAPENIGSNRHRAIVRVTDFELEENEKEHLEEDGVSKSLYLLNIINGQIVNANVFEDPEQVPEDPQLE